MAPGWRWVFWALGGSVCTLAFFDVTVDKRTIYTCLLCRAERTCHRTLGTPWMAEHDTALTAWYASRQGPHEHRWTRCSCTRGSNLFGRPTSWACGRNHPIAELPPEAELAFAEKADAAQWKAFLDGVLSADRKDQERAVNEARVCGIAP